MSGNAEVEQEDPHHEAGQRYRQEADASMGHSSCKQRACADANSEEGADGRLHIDPTTNARLHDNRYERQGYGAGHPEPADRNAADPQTIFTLEVAQQAGGRRKNVGVDLQVRGRSSGGWNEAARAPAGQCDQHQLDHDRFGRTSVAGGITTNDEAAQDRKEGGPLDQRIASGQFAGGEMVRQDAIFDGTKEGGDDA